MKAGILVVPLQVFGTSYASKDPQRAYSLIGETRDMLRIGTSLGIEDSIAPYGMIDT